MKAIFTCLLSLCLWPSLIAAAPSAPTREKLSDVYRAYKRGHYFQAIKELKKLDDSPKLTGTIQYWKALCYAKLQDYEKANVHFQKASQSPSAPKEIHYEFGQSLYASQNYKKARAAFARSVKARYRIPTSAYYIAYSSKALKDYPTAMKYFEKIVQAPSVGQNLKQAALFLRAETIYDQISANNAIKKDIESLVLPEFEKAQEVASTSSLAQDINIRMSEIKNEHGLGPLIMANGRKLKHKRYSFKINQESGYDTNVPLEADQTNSPASDINSGLLKTKVRGSYLFNWGDRWTTKPRLKVVNNYYTERDAAEVYQNDSYTLSADVYNTYEHTWTSKQSSALSNVLYSRTYRDYDQDKETEFYNETVKLELGEKLRYFDFGSTTLKISGKLEEHYNSQEDSITWGLSGTQIALLPGRHLLIATLSMNKEAVENDFNSETNYLLRADYIAPPIWPKTKLGGALSTTITDTEEQSDLRGTEVTLAPEVFGEYSWTRRFSSRLTYRFTSKSSEQESSYAYDKHSILLDLEITL